MFDILCMSPLTQHVFMNVHCGFGLKHQDMCSLNHFNKFIEDIAVVEFNLTMATEMHSSFGSLGPVGVAIMHNHRRLIITIVLAKSLGCIF